MAQAQGKINSYMDTDLHPRIVTDRILMQDPYDIPLYNHFGANPGKFAFSQLGKKVEWFEEAYPSAVDVADGGLTSGTVTTTFTPDTIALYQPGMVIQIDDELMWVSAVSTYLTVSRGWGSTTAATHVNDSAIAIVGQARLEGDDADDSPHMLQSTEYNYTQILQKTIHQTGTDMVLPHYAGYNAWDHEIDRGMEWLMEQLEKLPFHGKRVEGSASVARAAGGLDAFITTNATALASAALTRKAIETNLASIYNYGGDPDVIICSVTGKRILNSLFEGFFTREADNRFEGYRVDMLENPIAGRPLKVIPSRFCPTASLYICTSDKIGFLPLRPFFFEELAKTGDARKGEIVGEYTLAVAVEKHHGILSGFKTT